MLLRIALTPVAQVEYNAPFKQSFSNRTKGPDSASFLSPLGEPLVRLAAEPSRLQPLLTTDNNNPSHPPHDIPETLGECHALHPFYHEPLRE